MSNFKIALTAAFGIAIVIAVIIFALSKASSSSQTANLVVWGEVPQQVFDTAYKNSSLASNKQVIVSYVQKSPDTFDADLVNALADGIGPDVVIIREDSLYKNRNRLFVIPYASYPELTFKNTFIQEGEMFLSAQGVVALPFTVDPMVMYWNRDVFNSNAVAQPPKYWDDIYPLVPKMTKTDSSGSILKSTVALGEWDNIVNAKEIVSNLLLQAGTPITSRTSLGVQSVLNLQFNYPIPPSQSAVNFYTQFSNPTSPEYSWNRSLPDSLTAFLSGNSAMYLGFASEISRIQQKNPNLNFDVTYMPQIRNAPTKIVFGHMYALAIIKSSKQIAPAFTAAVALTEPSALTAILPITNLPPVRRDMLSTPPTDPFQTIFYSSALVSRSWIDPDPQASSQTFRDMIENITSGKARPSDALTRADQELTAELAK